VIIWKNIAGMVAAGNSRNKKHHQIRLSFASHAAYFPYRHEAGFVLAQLHNSRSAPKSFCMGFEKSTELSE
jgi:hypothetical protein